MYEENRKPLPSGDAAEVFANRLAEIYQLSENQTPTELGAKNIVRWANDESQSCFAALSRRLLLPGSGIVGIANLRELVQLAGDGKSCLLCLNHRSNLDVPTLDALLEDAGDAELFRKIIWVAGRKLEEDPGMTRVLAGCFNRVIVTPNSWFAEEHSDEQIHRARCLNIAADRAIAELRSQGWVFALFPSGTRARPGDKTTMRAIDQADSFLRMFDYLVFCNIDGCTLPVSKDRNLTHETPRLDRMIFTFGPVRRTEQWRSEALTRFEECDQRIASARAIQEDIEALAPRG